MAAAKKKTTKKDEKKAEKKPAKKPAKKKGGRTSKYTEAVVRKLELAFKNDFNISQACDYANISRDTYYDWLEKKKGFSDKMEAAKSHLIRQAKINVARAVRKGDLDTSKFVLERRAKDEYSTRQDVDMTGNVPVVIEGYDAIKD